MDETLVAPKIVKKLPKVVETRAGETTILEVQAIGKPRPKPKWLKANEEIIPSDDYLIENYPDGTSVLTIANVQPDTIDQITFEAVSPVGIAKTVTKVQVEGIISYLFEMETISDHLAFIKFHFTAFIKYFYSSSLQF